MCKCVRVVYECAVTQCEYACVCGRLWEQTAASDSSGWYRGHCAGAEGSCMALLPVIRAASLHISGRWPAPHRLNPATVGMLRCVSTRPDAAPDGAVWRGDGPLAQACLLALLHSGKVVTVAMAAAVPEVYTAGQGRVVVISSSPVITQSSRVGQITWSTLSWWNSNTENTDKYPLLLVHLFYNIWMLSIHV